MKRRGHLACAALALVTCGCDPRDFDRSLDNAPVRSVGVPSGYRSPDVGRVVLPLSVPANRPEVTARFLLAGTETPSLAVVDLDAAGKTRVHVAQPHELADLEAETRAPVKSAVELEDKRILLGIPTHGGNPATMTQPKGRVYYLRLLETEKGMTFDLQKGQDPGDRRRYGLAVAVGKVSGGPEEDYVVLSDEEAILVEDGREDRLVVNNNKPGCEVQLEAVVLEKYRFRALGVADLIAADGEEIAVGVPREDNAPGKVVILRKEDKELDCPLVIQAPGRQPRFGTSLAVGDFDGDGQRDDLLVGAPPDRAYLYLGPFEPGQSPQPVLELKHPDVPDGGPAGDFGFRVLAMDLDGTPGVELLVSAPEMVMAQKKGAGQVIVFRRDGSAVERIGDNNPDEEASFGFSLSALRFAPSGCGAERQLLIVGAIREVFTFFRVPGGPADPRCFPAKM
jgi:hypothetical protein